MEFKDRLISRMRTLDLKAIKLARLVGSSKGSVSQWVNGIAKPNGEKLVELSRILQCQPDWLLHGDNPRKKIESNASWSGSIETWDENTPLRNDEVEIPFLAEIELSAGSGKYAIEEWKGKKLRFNKNTLKKCGVEPENAVCVNVSGNSMEPVLTENSTVAIDKGRNFIKDGEMYAINHDGMLRVKLLYRLPGGGIRLKSYNIAEYPDEIYPARDIHSIHIIGWVFWLSVLKFF